MQKLVEFTDEDTLRTSYDKLQKEIQELFMDNWDRLKHQSVPPIKQNNIGVYHSSIDKEKYIADIKSRYLDMKIPELIDYAGDVQMSTQSRDKYVEEVKANQLEIKTKEQKLTKEGSLAIRSGANKILNALNNADKQITKEVIDGLE